MTTVARLLAEAQSAQAGSARLARERTLDQLSMSAAATSSSQLGAMPHNTDVELTPVSLTVGSYGDVVLERRSDPPGLGSTCLRPLRGRPSDHVALAACEVLDRRLCSHCGALEDRTSGGGGASGGGSFDLRRAVLQNRLQALMPTAVKEEVLAAATASLAAAEASGRSLTGLSLLQHCRDDEDDR